jgi:type III secretory pathway component EscT
MRALGVLVLFPFIKGPLKATVALVFSVWAMGNLDSFTSNRVSELFSIWSIFLYVQEFIFGCLIGCPIALFLRSGRVLGALVDSFRGTSLGAILNPYSFSSQNKESSPLAIYTEKLTLACLVLSGAIHRLAENYITSFKFVRVGSSVFSFEMLSSVVISLLTSTISQLILFLIPLILLSLLADGIAIIISKLVPGISANAEFNIFRASIITLLLVCICQRLFSEKIVAFEKIIAATYDTNLLTMLGNAKLSLPTR